MTKQAHDKAMLELANAFARDDKKLWDGWVSLTRSVRKVFANGGEADIWCTGDGWRWTLLGVDDVYVNGGLEPSLEMAMEKANDTGSIC